jgi:hypothetical protein
VDVAERIAVISANLGNYHRRTWFKQKNIPTAKLVMFTDDNFPPRKCMSSRLQARIPKCLGWQLVPGYDIYMWMDASFALLIGAVEWVRENLGDKEMVVFKHPHRKTVQEELDTIKSNDPYFKERFLNDTFDNWDGELYAGGIFMYRNLPHIQEMLKEWWYVNTRFTLNDQLALPSLLNEYKVSYNVIQEHIYNTKYFPRGRKRGRFG